MFEENPRDKAKVQILHSLYNAKKRASDRAL